MIKKSDLFFLAIKKLKIRKLRVFFTLVISALGIIIISAGIGLIKGVVNQDILDFFPLPPPDTVIIKGYNIPEKEIGEKPNVNKTDESSIEHYITDEHLKIIKNHKYYKDIVKPAVSYSSLVIDSLISWSYFTSDFTGYPDTFIRHYAGENYEKYITNPNVIPVIINENFVQNVYNPDSNTIEKITDYSKLLGKKVNIIVGDIIKNDLYFAIYKRDTSGVVTRIPIDENRWKESTKYIIDRYQHKYDMNVLNQTLTLKGVIVGSMPLNSGNIIPLEILKKCGDWIMTRNRLAALNDNTLEDLYSNTWMYSELSNFEVLTEKNKAVEYCEYLGKFKISADCREKMKEEKFKRIKDQLKMVKIILYSVSGIVMFFSGMFIWGTIGRVVNDSRREIGVFRAIGATKIDILKIYLTEAGILGILSSVLGIAGGQLIAFSLSKLILYYLNKEGAEKLPESLYGIDFSGLIILFLASILISLLAGFQPALKASKLDPVIALKTE